MSSARIVAPRARARSHSSRITTAAPSPITKPSRSRSNGRLAVLGSSLRSDSAFMFAKLASARGVIAASEPPATITSAWFVRIRSKASPTEWPDDAQARSEEHTSELQSHVNLVCRLLLEKKKEKLFTPLYNIKQKKKHNA